MKKEKRHKTSRKIKFLKDCAEDGRLLRNSFFGVIRKFIAERQGKNFYPSDFPYRLCFFLTFIISANIPAEIENTRTWTSSEGKAVLAKIMRIETDKEDINEKIIFLEVSGRETRVKLSSLSEKDQDYVEKFENRQPFGNYAAYPINPPSDQRDYLADHHLQSLLWKGRVFGKDREMPFQLHVPPADNHKKGEKLPLIIHLHGTGGFGTENLNPIFRDAGGLAKFYVGEEFQRYQPCYILIPQGADGGCWAGMDVHTPPNAIVTVADITRLLQDDENFDIDPARIYLVGLSLGGQGVFEGISNYPNLYAAGIPIAYVGFTQYFKKEWRNTRPLWIAINKEDLYYKKLRPFRKHYLEQGGEIRTTVFDQGGHDAWTKLLTEEGVRQWLFRQKIE